MNYFSWKRLKLACSAFLAVGILIGCVASSFGVLFQMFVYGIASLWVMIAFWLIDFLNEQEKEQNKQKGNCDSFKDIEDERYEELLKTLNPDPNPNCGCHECNPNAWWMLYCKKCGNKRCPKAISHRYKCTNSNDTNQIPELENE